MSDIAEFRARVANENKEAATIPTGTVVDTIFGATTLGRKFDEIEGWDLYEVYHSGLVHSWSSSVVYVTFGVS